MLGNWNPKALKGFERKKDDDGVCKWVKTDSKGIPEAPFRTSPDSFERLPRDGGKISSVGGGRSQSAGVCYRV